MMYNISHVMRKKYIIRIRRRQEKRIGRRSHGRRRQDKGDRPG